MQTETVDVIIFMGQSNMAGRGAASQAPVVADGAGYEYRAITASDSLSPLCEPFGALENDEAGVYEPGMKTGSMVSAFVNACYEQTDTPIVAVSCAKGGSSIGEWMSGGPYYSDAVRRMEQCEKWLLVHGYKIRHRLMAWCQGCTDADNQTEKVEYLERTRSFIHTFMKECGVETCFLIQIGNRRSDSECYVYIQEAQEELAAQEERIVLVSRLLKTFAVRGLMKDEFHYLQEGYNLAGEEAGRNAGRFLAKDCL